MFNHYLNFNPTAKWTEIVQRKFNNIQHKIKYLSPFIQRLIFNKDVKGTQYAAAFSVDDYDKLQNYAADIRYLRAVEDYDYAFQMSDNINNFINSRFNDHHPNLLGKYKVEALDAGVGPNKITTPGVVAMVFILSGQSERFFNWVSMGHGRLAEAIGQRKLQSEEIRVDILTDGSQAGRGTVWNHLGILGYGAQTARYYEFGVHDADTDPSNMLCRSVITNGVDHRQNETFMAASHSTIFEIR